MVFLVHCRRIVDASFGSACNLGATRGVIPKGTPPEVRVELLADLRLAFRALAQRPGFALVAIATLGLGAGLNTAIFSVVNAALLKPLPYEGAERLVALYGDTPSASRQLISEPDLADVARAAQSFETLAAFTSQTVNLTGSERPDRLRGGFVSATFFDVLKTRPALGRLFEKGEDQRGAARVAVLDHGAWRARFGGDASLIGRPLILNGESHTVVGVLPPGFRFDWDEIEVWLPFHAYPNADPAKRSARTARPLGRLRPGVGLEQARSELRTLAAGLERAYPDTNRGYSLRAERLQDVLVERQKPQLLTLFAVVGLVLLLACANVANLLLARGSSRRRELSIRAALGASRRRLARLMLAEAALLAAGGGLLAFAIAAASSGAIAGLVRVRHSGEPYLEPSVLGFSIAVTAFVTLLVGASPAFQLSREEDGRALRNGERGSSAGPRGERLRGAFVVSEIAIALALVVSTALLARSLAAVLERSPGFDAQNLLSLEYRLPRNAYATGASQWQFHKTVAERAAAVAGVEAATVVRALPFSGNGGALRFTVPGRFEPPEPEAPRALENAVAPNFFETMRIPLLRGRVFDERDSEKAPLVVVVNRMLAERFFEDADPLGQTLRVIGPNVTATIVGVVGDVPQYSLEDPERPQIYTAYAQTPHIFATLVARTRVPPLSLADAVRAAVWSVDKDQPVWKVRSVESLLDGSTAQRRALIGLLSGFTALALLLSGLGLYGVMSYAVAQRAREFGVRIALGAGRGLILGLVLSRGLRLGGAGIASGAAAAWATTRLLRGLLFGVAPGDPLAFSAAVVVLTAVAVLASLLPAWRATRVDPVSVLRSE
jgi:predicted permease